MMPDRIVEFQEPVTLLGGGASDSRQLGLALALAPNLVAADGGANVAVAQGLVPRAVIGDFDSVEPAALAAIPAERHMRLPEQETTDFEKCLVRIAAPLILGVGFTGLRADHTLAVWNALARHPTRRCLILGDTDIVFAAPPRLSLDLAAGTRLSLFPMAPVRGRSRGLRWPIDGIDFAPDGRIGTSNQTEGPVELDFDGAGMLVILPAAEIAAAVRAIRSAPRSPDGRAPPGARGG